MRGSRIIVLLPFICGDYHNAICYTNKSVKNIFIRQAGKIKIPLDAARKKDLDRRLPIILHLGKVAEKKI